jgi:hypothetical protein
VIVNKLMDQLNQIVATNRLPIRQFMGRPERSGRRSAAEAWLRAAAAQPGGGSNKKIRDQPHAPEPNLSRAIELVPNLLADYLLLKPKW